MNQYDPAELVDRLKKGGKISQGELSFVRARLRNPQPSDDLYDLIRALGLGVKPVAEDVALVEQYFFSETDDWTLQSAIYTLCDYWNLTKDYVDRLLFFVQPENWNDYPSAAIASFGALGDYLFATKDPNLFGKLLDLYEKHVALYHAGVAAYNEQYLASLYRALDIGIKGRAALLDHIKIKVPQDIREDLIREVRKRAKRSLDRK